MMLHELVRKSQSHYCDQTNGNDADHQSLPCQGPGHPKTPLRQAFALILVVNYGAREPKKAATEHETPNNTFEQVKS